MNIACIAWGSLIWNPEGLLIRREWFCDGPLLPVEYTRQSMDGRLTLVITPSAKDLRTLWALMATDDPKEAINSLGLRELKSTKNISTFIGFITTAENPDSKVEKDIQDWLRQMNLDAAVWTKLPSKFSRTENRIPTFDEAIAYIKDIDLNKRKLVEEYVRRTPKQIDTDYRRGFEKELGWV